METLPRIALSRAEMIKRVARFKDLKGFDGGLPDSKISEGFNLGYCRAKPGCGPMMHNHDTNETFIPMTGRWRASWENENGEVEHVDLDPLDVVSFPPGMIRRFENITEGYP